MSGADSTIPINGIVISGHGIAKNWISQNLSVGSKVYIDTFNKTITVYTTSDSYIFEAEAKISEAKSMINYYQETFRNYNQNLANKHIQIAENYLKNAGNEKQNSTMRKQYPQ